MPKKKTDIGRASLLKHKQFGGKLEVVSKVPLETHADFSMYYTPGVGAVATHLGKHPKDARIYSIKKNTVAVVSDGTAVLGLGNIGPYGALPVMEGKAAIFKSMANVDAFPIVLDTHEPDEVIETIVRIAPAFGGINLEDISAPNCFYIEEELKRRLNIPVMHDDQHGTAIVVLAALTNALKVVKKKKEDTSITIIGSGAAGTAVALLLHNAGFSDIVVVDRTGAITRARKSLAPHKKKLMRLSSKRTRTMDAARAAEASDVLIGVSGPGGITERMVASMNKDGIVFALANPTPEIMPDIAHRAGARIVATGRSDFPNQVNNALVFPGIFRGALDKGVSQITDEMKIKAAYVLARLVKKPTVNNILPWMTDKRATKAVARAV